MNNAMIADQKRRERFALQQQKLRERTQKTIAKEQKAAYVQSRINAVAKENTELGDLINQQKNVLINRNKYAAFDIEKLKEKYVQPEFVTPSELRGLPEKPILQQYMPKPLPLFFRLFAGKRKAHDENIRNGEQLYKKAFTAYEILMIERAKKIEVERQKFILKCNDERNIVNDKNKLIDEVIKGYKRGIEESVCAYLEAGLENLVLPEGCMDFFEVEFNSPSKELIVECLLPSDDIIPTVEDYVYKKTNDEIGEKLRKQNEIKELHQNLIFNITLRVLYEIFAIDVSRAIDNVLFNGFIEINDPGTEKKIKQYIVALRTNRNQFLNINLDRVNNRVCLRELSVNKIQAIPNLEQIADNTIIDITGQGEKIIHPNVSLNITSWEGLEEKKQSIISAKQDITNTTFESSYEENYKLGTKYKTKLGLNPQEISWLNKFYIPDNVFLSIEGCCIATIRLYLTALKELNKILKKNNTTIIQEVGKLKAAMINVPQIYYPEGIEADVFYTIFKRVENVVRTNYLHKRKLSEDFHNRGFENQFESALGRYVYEILAQQKQFILLPDKETLIELNAQNTQRWKEELEQIILSIANGHEDAVSKIYRLGEENIKNLAIENIFFEAAKEIAKHDKSEALKLYLQYIYYNSVLAKIEGKALPKAVQNTLFITKNDAEEFQKIAADLKLNKDLAGAIDLVSKMYVKGKKKVLIDLDHIDEVKAQHSETVDILGQLLADEEDSPNEASLTINVTQIEVPIATDTTHNLLPILSENQIALLFIFQEKELKMSGQEIESYAKSRNIFRRQLIDSINENCYEIIDDVLIEEDGHDYSIAADYFNKIKNFVRIDDVIRSSSTTNLKYEIQTLYCEPKLTEDTQEKSTIDFIDTTKLTSITNSNLSEIKGQLPSHNNRKSHTSFMNFLIYDHTTEKSVLLYRLARTDFITENRISLDEKAISLYSALTDHRRSFNPTESRNVICTILEKLFEVVIAKTAEENCISLLDIRADKYQTFIQNNIVKVVNEISNELVNNFGLVLLKYFEGYMDENGILINKSLKWLQGEYSSNSQAWTDLGVSEIIDEINQNKILKCYCKLFAIIDYSGFMINFEDRVSLYRIPSSSYKLSTVFTREANFQKLMSFKNDNFDDITSNLFILFNNSQVEAFHKVIPLTGSRDIENVKELVEKLLVLEKNRDVFS